MASPGNLKTTPSNFVYFNAPFDQDQRQRIVLQNTGGRAIGYHLNVSGSSGIAEVDRKNGYLEPGQEVTLNVLIKKFSGTVPAISINFESVDAPANATNAYNRGWFINNPRGVVPKQIEVKFNE